MESLVTYLVTAMLSWVPLYAHAPGESAEDARGRYESIAHDVAQVVLDGGEEPLFGGTSGRAETAILMLSVASFESSFKKSVDNGIGRGDNGRSYCLMQIHVGAGTTLEGWSGPELVENRQRCFRAALHILRGSFGVCRKLPIEDRLSAYATGRCLPNVEISRSRVGRARTFWESHAPPPATPLET
jgi:hypothetical protein